MDEIKYVSSDDVPASNLMQWLPMLMFVALISCCLALAVFNNVPVIVSPATETPGIIEPTKERTPTTTIVVPTATEVVGTATTTPTLTVTTIPNTSTPTSTPKAPPRVTPTPTTVVLPTVHLIVPGDNLWNIAEKYYNDGLKFLLICEVNNLIHNCDLIHSDNSLTIPK